jgi:uncharacterized protein YndB with AHSA1/START domain
MSFDSGPPTGATVVPDGDGAWTLIFVRELRHAPERVWAALTDPAEIDRWAPYAASRPLATTGDATLTMVDGAERVDLPSTVLIADEPRLLEHTWGADRLRWELESSATGTRLTLRHSSPNAGIEAQVAAGWHLCVAVLERLLDGDPVGVIRGHEARDHGWEDLRAAYEKHFAG